MRDTSGNIAFREIENLPKYEQKWISRKQETKENEVMLAVTDTVKTTYRLYAVTADGETKAVVNSQEEAQNMIDEVKIGLNEAIDLKLGITEIYTTDNQVQSKEEATNILNSVKGAKIAVYEQIAQEQAKKEQQAKKEKTLASKAQSIATATATTTTAAATGNLSGMALAIPVNGSISSRFGSRSSSRSSAHTGLDISTSLGTGVRPIAPGTVTYAGYKGSYGNLVIINHGNGVESYYAHCNALYVSVGQSVDTGTTISAVGSTGNSTGPHLHLEIRINGTPVNPQQYLY